MSVREEFAAIWARCAPYTMTSPVRGYGLYLAVNYVCQAGIEGDFVECGVWRGGSTMLAALTSMARGRVRDLWMYDTFAGMTRPGNEDYCLVETKETAEDTWQKCSRNDGINEWCFANLEDVRANLLSTGYPAESLHFVSGAVEDTLPKSQHKAITILRLDTDWYESTKIELDILYPSLAVGGVMIIDDYGHWAGARKAVDEYFAAKPPLLVPLDYTCYLAVKS